MQQYISHVSNLTTQIPDDVARLAHEQQLGTPQTSFSITKLGQGWRWIRFMPLVSILIILAAFLVIFITLSIVYDSRLFLSLFIPTMISGYTFLLVYVILFSIIYKRGYLYPCDKGLILRFSSSKFRVLRWDEIETIWQTSERSLGTLYIKNQSYRIRSHDGDVLTLRGQNRPRSPHNNSKNLDEIIEEQFTRRLLPFHLADYQAGQTLTFGPLNVNRDGINVHASQLSWEQIAAISLVKDQRLVIYKTGEKPEIWAQLTAFKIPNLSILLALLRRTRSGSSDQEAHFEALTTIYGATATVVQNERTMDALPEGLAALAEEHQLGERRLDQQLGRSRLVGWPTIIGLLILQTTLFAFISGGVLLHIFAFSSINHSFWWTLLNEFAILSLVFSPSSIISLIRHLRQFPNHTYVFEHGIIFKRGQAVPAVWRWEDIQTTWRKPSFMSTYNRRQQPYVQTGQYAYKLQMRNGAQYTLSRLNINQTALSQIIKEQVVPLQLPELIDAYHTGQTLAFGKVRLNQQGISIGARLLPWSQVKSVGLQGDILVIFDITRHNPWGRAIAAKVPNLFLLFALTDYVRDSSHSKEPD